MNFGYDKSKIDFTIPFRMLFDLRSGISPQGKPSQRKLSHMKGMYADLKAYSEMLGTQDPLVYEFYELGAPVDKGDIAFGTSIVYPGKVGNEYFMTKGHFHSILDTAEVYFCLSGQGLMLMETPEGDWYVEEFTQGSAVYCPKRYAHRSINTGDEPLVTFFAFRADAGHDYGSIEKRGFRKLLIESNGNPMIIDNPHWKINVS
jgi:glucose-6-phosphate isomerase